MRTVQFWKAGYCYLCELQRPKNTHLPGKHMVLYRTDSISEMKEFRNIKGI